MLKALMLRKRINDAKKTLEELRAKGEELEKREADIAASIEEANTEEEKAAVEEATAAFEADSAAHEAEKAALEKTIEDCEAELAEIEAAAPQERKTEEKTEKRKEVKTMEIRKFFNMNAEQRDAFFAREDVKSFLERVRSMKGQTRAVSGADLLIPEVILDVLRENIENYSKLYKHVNVKRVPGKARQIVAGTIPEGVWTEMCGKLNELSISFNDAEVDGYKVGGYIAICNSILEDSDINLASEVITALGQAIGYALDKAIVFGTGTKMPVGIFTRLAQTAEPDSYPTTARPWADLHTTNILTIANSVKGANLYKEIVLYSGAAKGAYSKDEKVWIMNESTYTRLVSESISLNAAGAIVAGQGKKMPVIGGEIEILSFMPNDVIIGGYADLYLLAERAGTAIAQSEHALFTDDKTVIKGTARYDGMPVIAEAFVAIGINGVTPSASGITFADDTANA